ncbi:MAG: D-alanyl-D-alanine carboxypeptidase/D-alanyl-D-alanine-endopeptidase [Gemmatimonadetes bacterium]|nr:D-alanyl-D-alanine carboxypeptidase/D-alanyl-D-alanine-endopeptidase [Gemmatimonadota bacterium]
MINRSLHRLHVACRRFALPLLVASASLHLAAVARAQGPLAKRIDRLLDRPPFDRATWSVLAADSAGRVLYQRNADRLMIPASNNKLLVGGIGMALLGPDYRVTTSIYGGGPLENGVLLGDLIVYGRGDPTFSAHCYGIDTLAMGACDSVWTGIDALADSLVARGVQQIAGAIVGDGSYFDPQLVHDAWEQYDLNWWYAAPVSGLGFNDNSVDVSWKPGPRPGAPAQVSFEPDLSFFSFQNRSRTTLAGVPRTLDFFRQPGTMFVWAEGTVPLDNSGRTEYFALPDPNLYFAHALRSSLARKGISVAGPTLSTTDSLRYREAREAPALVSRQSRPLSDFIFPILNSSQNWFAEMLLKIIGRERGAAGSWSEGLQVERRFLIDSVGVDSSAFALVDASGLAKNNLVTTRTLAQILGYTRSRAGGDAFVRALPRAGQLGSLRQRFVGTPVEGHVVAKTGSVSRVNALSGYLERPKGGPLVFSIIVNNHTAPSRAVLAEIDSVVVEMAK